MKEEPQDRCQCCGVILPKSYIVINLCGPCFLKQYSNENQQGKTT